MYFYFVKWIFLRTIITGLAVSLTELSIAQIQVPLYKDNIPNSKPADNLEVSKPNDQVDTLTFNVSVPRLAVFLPAKEKANGTAIIICPGGGYHVLLSKREGTDVAKALNRYGIAAFVLNYRLPDNRILVDKSIGPLQDAQQALKMLRDRSKEWNINPGRIGIMGFSAGGHLAATAGTHFDDSRIQNLSGTSLRPDFMILVNPVMSFSDSIGEMGSRHFLVGDSPSIAQIQYFSNELHVNNSTPPSFLVHSGADTVVSVENSIAFYEALKRNNVPADLHIYAKGEHGFLTWPHFDEWFGRCINWLQGMSLVAVD